MSEKKILPQCLKSHKSLGLSKLSEIFKLVKNCQSCQKLSKLSELSKFSEIVMSPHHSDQMSQRLQVSRIVFVIVFVPKKIQRSSKEVPKKFQRSSKEVPKNFQKTSKKLPKKSSRKSSKLSKKIVRSCLLITLIKCLKGHRSLGSLFDVKSKSILSE